MNPSNQISLSHYQAFENEYNAPYTDSYTDTYFDPKMYNWDAVEEEEFEEWSGGPHGRRLAEVNSKDIIQHYLQAPTHRSLLLKAKEESYN